MLAKASGKLFKMQFLITFYDNFKVDNARLCSLLTNKFISRLIVKNLSGEKKSCKDHKFSWYFYPLSQIIFLDFDSL